MLSCASIHELERKGGASGAQLASQLFGVSPIDPGSLSAAAALLLPIGVCAAYLPARRATQIDPPQALRSE